MRNEELRAVNTHIVPHVNYTDKPKGHLLRYRAFPLSAVTTNQNADTRFP